MKCVSEFTQFFLQPKFHISTGFPIGAEALIRIDEEFKGLLHFNEVISRIESEKERLSFLKKAIKKNVMFFEENGCFDRNFSLSINMPAGIISNCKEILQLKEFLQKEFDTKVRKSLIFEITERTSHSGELEKFLMGLFTLKSSGVRISLDDFGTGYNSMHLLMSPDIDEIKVDKIFIGEKLGGKGRIKDVLCSFISIAQILSVDIVVEGIETEYQKNILVSSLENTDFFDSVYGQGSYFCKPLTPNDFVKYLNLEEN